MTLDDVVASHLTPLLESRGFTARRRRFRRERPDFSDFLCIGRGQGLYEGKFCIELFTQPHLNLPLPEGRVEPETCWFRTKLAPGGLEDKWWPTKEISASDVAELRLLIGLTAESWFEHFPSISGAFVERWPTLEAGIRDGSAGRRYGAPHARIAFVSALSHRLAGLQDRSRAIAQLARETASPAETNFLRWLDDLEAGAFDRDD
ncbi:hypothetical protein [Defluviimonas salinarum]|uniref:DUF4304 domain-containing protein n=1 Tax=Defluviimonas salinarum TaxID=2992147 RepID=A0ABT3J7R4_9RHOB|nr:hypothetical protein [Defluviimonas salinarum]MCW3783690.1 hypothetical protein [Defluviimonas salinarum]